jgi:hypothetical protein
MSVLLLLTIPAARNPVALFSRAIACSPVGLHYRFVLRHIAISPRCNVDHQDHPRGAEDKGHLRPQPCLQRKRSQVSQQFTAVITVTSATSCLRQKSFHEIVSVQLLGYIHLLEDGYNNFLPWLPLIAPDMHGGLKSNPLEAFRSGDYHRVPVIIGSVMNETDAWIPKSLNDTVEVQRASLSGGPALYFHNFPAGRVNHACFFRLEHCFYS